MWLCRVGAVRKVEHRRGKQGGGAMRRNAVLCVNTLGWSLCELSVFFSC